MSNYLKITDYAAKDLLLHLNPAKAIKGTEVGAEFDAIATMSATKGDKSGTLAQFAATTSLQLAGVISDETGSGALVFANSPTLVTPALGIPASGTLTNCTGLPQAGVTGLTTADSPQFAGVNVGHATDTTITRVSAGIAAIEGNNILTAATGLPLSGGTMTGDIIMSSASIIEAEGAAVASAATCDIWATDGGTKHITGTTGISSFGTAPQAGMWMKIMFDGVLTLTHGANLNLPGSANITTAADDFAFVYADTTTQFDVLYFRKDGTAVVGGVTFSSSAENIAGTIENKAVDPLGIREAFNCTGTAPVYACRAWVNFDGTGTPTIRASGNVTSITDNGTGDYTINFTTAMPDANYAVTGLASSAGSTNGQALAIHPTSPLATSSVRVLADSRTAGVYDPTYVCVAVFR